MTTTQEATVTTKISDQIRDAIRNSGLTCYAISQQTGVDKSVLSRFMNAKSGLTTATLDDLAGVLGLTLQVGRAGPR